jgi:hypothetical protein
MFIPAQIIITSLFNWNTIFRPICREKLLLYDNTRGQENLGFFLVACILYAIKYYDIKYQPWGLTEWLNTLFIFQKMEFQLSKSLKIFFMWKRLK